MKFFLSLAGFILAVGFILNAQTNSTPAPAAAKAAAHAAGGTNGQTELRPTEIVSDSSRFYLRSNVFVYRGNVHVNNPQMKLTCDLLTVEAPKMTNADEKFNRATALTNVVIDWMDDRGPNHATSYQAVYTFIVTNTATPPEKHWETNKTVVLTGGNPAVTNMSGVFQGDPIIWDCINDTITSPNMQKTLVNQTGTNTTDLFGTSPAPKNNSAPTNEPGGN